MSFFSGMGRLKIAVFTDGDQATTQVITDGFALGSRGMGSKIKAMINFSRNIRDRGHHLFMSLVAAAGLV